MDETVLLAAGSLKRGENTEAASRHLVGQLAPRLRSYFLHHSFSPEDSDDLVQEVFRRVFMGIGALKNEALFLGWIFQIARNVRLSALTRRGLNPFSGEGLEIDAAGFAVADQSPSPLTRTISHEELRRALEAIDDLPSQQRQCLRLRVLREMSYREIGDVLKLSSRTVRNHLREARIHLRKEFSKREVTGFGERRPQNP